MDMNNNATPTSRPKAAYYAVAAGRKPGVYTTWNEAEAQVKGYAGAKYKKFPTQTQAEEFISTSSSSAFSSLTSSTTSSSSTSKNNKPYSKPPTLTPFNTHRRAESPTTQSSPSSLPDHLQEIASRGYAFTKDYYLIVHTDGSALGNGQKGSRAGAGVFWGESGEAAKKNYSERVPGLTQTNNRGELLAVIRALEQCPYPDVPLEIRCDSQYTISCMTTWLPKWLRTNFRTSSTPYTRSNANTTTQQQSKQISNVDMVKHLLVLLRRRSGRGKVKFKYVPAHSGIEGNERADQLAKMGSLMPESNGAVKWLTPEEEEISSTENRKDAEDMKGLSGGVTDVEVELDENWLMSAEELDNFEKDLMDE
uniref:Ribonuclease H n=1 Tax=Kwoniella bestiolae CBS 10118 TaxID=1296100 RepID=A0A1B9GE70_9TREE|nr:hypothetical protein I302_00811 [Kwoniella bestiolae CBS 10118]OCF29310.1 hypothetical protein I302_00811 [Kwoniella bestiolae CBS 10118]